MRCMLDPAAPLLAQAVRPDLPGYTRRAFMDAPIKREHEHAGYRICFDPVRDAVTGLYRARAELQGLNGAADTIAVLSPEVAPFIEAEDAAAFALAYAVKWIDSGVGWQDWPDSGAAPLQN